MAANAVCKTDDRPISVSDGTDTVQHACQPHPVVRMEGIPYVKGTQPHSGLRHHEDLSKLMCSPGEAKKSGQAESVLSITAALCCSYFKYT